MTKKTTSKKPKSGTHSLTLADGTVVTGDFNSATNLRKGKSGKPTYPEPIPDVEAAPVEDEYSQLKYPPPKVHKVFRKTWAGFIDNVVSRDNFKPSHLHTLEILCDLYVELEDLNAFLRTHGMAYKVVTIYGEHRRMYPEVAQRDKIRGQIQSYSKLLDLFPKKDHRAGGVSSGEESEWE